ncbi:MAG: response regulator [Gammaproteobacteria bacterium]|nr:response regulator [Gammaproteobacteria bacterium]
MLCVSILTNQSRSGTIKSILPTGLTVKTGAAVCLAASLILLLPFLYTAMFETYSRLYVDLPLLVMVIVSIQYRLRRIDDRAEKRFWNLWSLGFIAWLLQVVLLLATQSESIRSVGISVAGASIFFLFYVALAMALERQPHLSGGHFSHRLRLIDWLGVFTFFLGVLMYFVIIPRLLEPEESSSSWTMFYIIFDLYLAIRLTGFIRNVSDPRWRRIYAWLLAAALLWLCSDTLGLSALAGAIGSDHPYLAFDPFIISSYFMVLIAARSREYFRDPADTLADPKHDKALRSRSQLGPLVFYAMIFPLLHLGMVKSGLFEPSLAAVRESVVLVFLVLLSILAYVYQRTLEADNRRLESERIKTTNALNQQLLRTQKMDAVGQLTGGIAHDFNNILAIILGNLELLELQIKADDKAAKFLRPIQKSAERAAELTQKLLIFSGNHPVTVTVTDINKVVADMGSLVGRSMTPEVKIEHKFAADLWKTEVNAGDFEDALVNLVVNARDAMPGGGTLTLETHNRFLDDDYCAQNPGVEVGEYVELAVSDAGKGISLQDQQHIFEPFFTTKEMGTGLGLAMVYGFANRSGGHVDFSSETGIGSTFRIYLPRAAVQEHPQQTIDVETEALPRGKQTLLVVDDEKELRQLARTQLESLGYRILVAGDGHEALAVLAEGPHIDLLISDVVMPGGMNGYELAEQVTAICPGIKVLMVSGHQQEIRDKNGQSRFTAKVLAKPYTLAELAKRVGALMDNASPA